MSVRMRRSSRLSSVREVADRRRSPRPRSARSGRRMQRPSVVLPLPLSPITPSVSPAPSVNGHVAARLHDLLACRAIGKRLDEVANLEQRLGRSSAARSCASPPRSTWRSTVRALPQAVRLRRRCSAAISAHVASPMAADVVTGGDSRRAGVLRHAAGLLASRTDSAGCSQQPVGSWRLSTGSPAGAARAGPPRCAASSAAVAGLAGLARRTCSVVACSSDLAGVHQVHAVAVVGDDRRGPA